MLAKLSELMFVEAIRRYAESLPPEGKGWLAGVRDAQIGRALAFLHGEPGRAWYMLLPTLNNERIMVAAFCMGVLDGVLEDALDYMKQRKAFGKTIGEFQILQHYVADMAIWRQAGHLMLHYTADLQSKGKPCHMESSMLKVLASEYAVKAADLGIQILGGMGYSAETDMQRYWRDARLWRIGPITNEMARNGIAEGLGLPRSF